MLSKLVVTDFVVVKLDAIQIGAVGAGEDLSPRKIKELSNNLLVLCATETHVLLNMNANDADALRRAVAGIARACSLSSECSVIIFHLLSC